MLSDARHTGLYIIMTCLSRLYITQASATGAVTCDFFPPVGVFDRALIRSDGVRVCKRTQKAQPPPPGNLFMGRVGVFF